MIVLILSPGQWTKDQGNEQSTYPIFNEFQEKPKEKSWAEVVGSGIRYMNNNSKHAAFSPRHLEQKQENFSEVKGQVNTKVNICQLDLRKVK